MVQKVKFLNCGGYPNEPAKAVEAGFVEGETYTVRSLEEHSWFSYYYIEGKPGKWNTVMFNELREPSREDILEAQLQYAKQALQRLADRPGLAQDALDEIEKIGTRGPAIAISGDSECV